MYYILLYNIQWQLYALHKKGYNLRKRGYNGVKLKRVLDKVIVDKKGIKDS